MSFLTYSYIMIKGGFHNNERINNPASPLPVTFIGHNICVHSKCFLVCYWAIMDWKLFSSKHFRRLDSSLFVDWSFIINLFFRNFGTQSLLDQLFVFTGNFSFLFWVCPYNSINLNTRVKCGENSFERYYTITLLIYIHTSDL